MKTSLARTESLTLSDMSTEQKRIKHQKTDPGKKHTVQIKFRRGRRCTERVFKIHLDYRIIS